ncbi:PilZ domain-containing protein [Candidatus Latescibacterota bacterium]
MYDRTTEKVIGYLIDISAGGLLLIADKPFTKDAHYSFRMDFTPILDYEHQVEFDVRCA